MSEFHSIIRAVGIVPVVVIESPEHALPLADAFIAGGVPIVEVTFRTSAAAEVIRILRRERPNMLVGAGTVITAENVRAACEAGAQFAVAPGCNPQTISLAAEQGLPFVPGVCTPTDIEIAFAHGCTLQKFYPSESSGGLSTLNAIALPYRHLGVRFMPTGGVTPGNLASYLQFDGVVAVGGTWLAKTEDLIAGRWQEITERCQAAVAVAKSVRHN
jgi:2-dehydro-3-deoxyphosphogluconate aldolase/(4S)-4-hydroxy-2-oxoglutarate aldolase